MTRTTLAPSVTAFTTGTKQLFIGGKFVDAADGASFSTVNPADESVLVTVAEAGEEDIDRAVAAARTAFGGPWGALSGAERARLLWRVGDLIEANLDELAQLETLDSGKPLMLSAMEVAGAAGHWRYFAGWCDKIEGTSGPVASPVPGMQFQRYSLRQPLGVVGLIIPWNFPLVGASYKLAPALAAGNAVVLKPAEQTPLTALRLAELLAEAGFPAGAVNIVPGFGPRAGAALAQHGGVDKVSFTGSTEVGRRILTAAGGNLKKVTLELGGKSPGIVFADADLPSAILGAAQAVFLNSGQVCTAASRLFVEEPVYDQVLEGLAQIAGAMTVGDGLDPTSQLGPLISAEQLERVSGYVQSGREEGASVVAGGEVRRPGYFHHPTLLAVNSPALRVAREEIFGPVVVAQKFSGLDEVVEAGNDSEYGLAAGVWTSDHTKAQQVAARLQAGIVWVNCFMVSDPSVSVGGTKQSGTGYDMGPEAVYGFTHLKAVVSAM